MSRPVRVQLSRQKGWRMPPNTVKVDRTSKWGNPFMVSKHLTQEEAVKRYRIICARPGAYFDGPFDPDRSDQMIAMARAQDTSELRGKNLACWCKAGSPCHADVLLELANAPAQPPGAEP